MLASALIRGRLETQDYWYFGITGHTTITTSLISATGSDQGFLTANPSLNLTGLFHMYGTGFVQKVRHRPADLR